MGAVDLCRSLSLQRPCPVPDFRPLRCENDIAANCFPQASDIVTIKLNTVEQRAKPLLLRKTSRATITACLLALSSTAALAQDWSGAYYGGALGFGTGSYDQGIEALNETGETVDISGLVYGVHAGVNFQNGPFVFGADAALSNGPTGAADTISSSTDYTCRTGDCYVDINAIGTLRGRLGITTDIRTLVYAAGGLAVANVDGGIRNSAQDGSSIVSGVTYAVGAERITSPFSTVFAEIGYYDLGTLTFGTNSDADPAPAVIDDFTATGDFVTIRAGISFKF